MMVRFSAIVAVFAAQLPFYLVWLVGLILAIVFWKKQPKASLLAVLGLAGIFILNVLSIYINTFLSMDLYKSGMTAAEVGRAMALRTIVFNILGAGFWGMIISSIFVDRKRTPEMPQIPNRF